MSRYLRASLAGPLTVCCLSTACDFYPDPQGDTGVPVDRMPTPADCDPTIPFPTGILAGDAPAADPHAETYGASPTPFAVHYSWPSRDPSRNAAFVWRTDVDTLASQIQYGPADTFPEGAITVDGGSFRYGSGVLGEGPQRAHEARLCGVLEPDTRYSYRVGGEGAWSEVYTFQTPKPPGTFKSFRVAMAGDSRGTYATWGQLVAAAETHEPDFYLFSGDMVDLGANQVEWDDWFAASGRVFAEKALIAAHGNHEFLAQHYFAQFSFPGNEEWYAVEYGDLLIVTLNDTVRDRTQIEVDQAQFLDQALRNTTMKRKIVNHHQPLYSTCTTHGSRVVYREIWAPIIEQFGVDMVLSGHNHIYERSLPIRDGAEQAPGEGTLYVVSGGAGADLYPNSEAEWFGDVAQPVEHYLIADFGPRSIDVVARDLSGNVIDSFSIPR